MQTGKANKKELSAPTQVVGIPTPIIQCPPDPPRMIHPDQTELGREVSPPAVTLQRCQEENNKFPGIFYSAEA